MISIDKILAVISQRLEIIEVRDGYDCSDYNVLCKHLVPNRMVEIIVYDVHLDDPDSFPEYFDRLYDELSNQHRVYIKKTLTPVSMVQEVADEFFEDATIGDTRTGFSLSVDGKHVTSFVGGTREEIHAMMSYFKKAVDRA